MSGAVTEDRAVAQRGGPTVAAMPVGLSQFFSDACPKRPAVRPRSRA